MTISDSDLTAIADTILAAGDAAGSISPITEARPDFDLPAAHRVSAEITRRRVARGERRRGWKIGFTNRTIWDEYDVHAPIWGPIYNSTLVPTAQTGSVTCAVAPLAEPRIEPEIAFRIATPPDPAMDEGDLIDCLDGVGHSFEIVQSVFPGWKFKAADTIAAFALHGRLFVGPLIPIEDRAGWLERLRSFEVILSRDGVAIDRGQGANVLGSPVSALLHFVRGLDQVSGERLDRGDLVSTGTVTRAFPVHAGERWSSEIIGLPLKGLAVTFK